MNLGEKIISYIVLIAVIVIGFRFLPPLPISSIVTQKQTNFSVSGTGKVTAIPDTATISLGVQITKSAVKEAQANANTITNNVIEALKKLGIETKDIKTENYSIYPNYDYTNGRNRINGYNVTENLIVTVRNLDKINDVIDQTAALGLNNVGGISLTVNDDKLKQLQSEARTQAIKEAKAKATELAQESGMTLGRIIDIQESQAIPPRPLFATADVKMGMGGGGESTNIQSGGTDITSIITLTFETR